MAVAAIAAIVVGLGSIGLGLGASEDELALVQVGPAWRAFEPVQLGINPPLWPFVVNALFPQPWVVAGGRWLSLLCLAGSVLVGGRIAARFAGAPGAIVTALLLATSPNLFASGVAFRAYAPLTLLALLHLDAAVAGATRRWAITGALLPWLHYLALPWTALGVVAGLVDPTRRAAALRCWPALLAWAPPVYWVWAHGGDRTRVGTPLDAIVNALELGWFEGSAWTALGGGALAIVAFGAAHERRAWPLAAAAVGAPLVLAAATLVQQVRPPAVALYLVALFPRLGARPGAPEAPRRLVLALAVVLVAASARGLPDAVPDAALLRAFPDTVDGWATFRDAAAGEPVQLPVRQVGLLLYELDGRLVADLPDDPTCPDRRCFTHDGLRITAAGEPAHGLVLAPASPAPSPFVGCAEVARHGAATLRRCP